MVRKVVFHVMKDIIDENVKLANELQKEFNEAGVKVLEFLGGPGSGKTSIIERLIPLLLKNYEPNEIGYIGGDIATSFDTERIARYGVRAVQINTGGTCHLEVRHVRKAIEALGGLRGLKILFIENVGNLICPFSFPLGAHARILVLDVASGEDKPLKHPMSVRKSDIIVVNKIDIAKPLGVDVEKIIELARKVNPKAPIMPVSAKTGEGIIQLYSLLKKLLDI